MCHSIILSLSFYNLIPKGSIKCEVTENTLLIHVHAKLLKLTIEYSHGWSDWNIVAMNLVAQSICNYIGFPGW